MSLSFFELLTAKDLDTKGDIFVGSGGAAIGILAVGSDAKVLMADSGEVLGIKWAAIAGTGDMTKAVYDIDGDEIVDAAAGIDDGVHAATAKEIKDAVNIVLGSNVAAEVLRQVYIPSGEKVFFDTTTGEVRTRVSSVDAGTNTLVNQAFSFAASRLQAWA